MSKKLRVIMTPVASAATIREYEVPDDFNLNGLHPDEDGEIYIKDYGYARIARGDGELDQYFDFKAEVVAVMPPLESGFYVAESFRDEIYRRDHDGAWSAARRHGGEFGLSFRVTSDEDARCLGLTKI